MRFSSRFGFVPLISFLALLGGCSSDDGTRSTAQKTVIQAVDKPKTAITAMKPDSGKGGRGAQATTSTGSAAASSTEANDVPLTGPVLLVTGRITFADGKPATSASLELNGLILKGLSTYGQDVLTTGVTDAEGNYRLRCADSIRPTLSIRGDLPATDVSLDSNGLRLSTKLRTRHIKRDVVLAQSYKVTGRLVNEKDEPMPGLAVKIAPKKANDTTQFTDNRTNTPSVTTSTATGDFSFENVAAGSWNFGATSPDYASITETFEIPTTDPITLRFSSRGGTVQGVVVMKGDGKPVPDITVGLAPRHAAVGFGVVDFPNTKTDASGKFQFKHVTSQTLVAQASTPPETTLPLKTAKPEPGPIKVDEGETTDVVLFVYPGHTIVGTVFDKDTSEPLSGAEVSLYGSENETVAIADSSGNYRLGPAFGFNDGGVQITVKHDGYALETANYYNNIVPLKLPEDYEEPVVKDLPMVRLITISGKVVTKDEVPVPQAMVKLKSQGSYSFSKQESKPVNSDGTFKLDGKPFDNAMVIAEADGYSQGESKALEVTAENIDDVKVIMDVGGMIQGTVLDPAGKPASGARVGNTEKTYNFGGSTTYGSNDEIAITGEDGQFTMRDAPTTVELHASKEAFANSQKVKVEIQPGETRTGVILQLRTGEIISGRVVKPGGEPIEGANLSASGQDGTSDSATSDKDGKFKLDGLVAGICNIWVYGAGENKNLQNIKTGTTDLEIVLGNEEGIGVIIGTVVDDITEKPIPDFTVTGFKAKKLPQPGKFELRVDSLNMGYGVKLSAPGYMEQSVTVGPVGASGSMEQTFKLGRGGAIKGRVVEKGSGKPVPNVMVINWGTLEYYERNQKSPVGHTITDEQGRFTLAPAPSSENHLIIKPKEPLAEVSKNVTVKSEETADAGDIELSNGGTIRGRVVRGTGDEPVPNKQVSLTAFNDGYQVNKKATTNENGEFEFSGLTALDYTLTVGASRTPQKLGADEIVDVVIRIGGVKVSGTVVRGGAPVGASVRASGSDQISISTYAQNGTYAMEDVIPGKYEFSVGNNQNGSSEIKETVEIPDEPEFVKDFVLPDGRMNVTVTDAAGQPVPIALVSLRLKNSDTGEEQSWVTRAKTETTKPDGTVNFEGLTPGVYEVSANKNDVGAAMNGNVAVRDGVPADVKLQLKGDGGTLVSVALSVADGKPVANAWCYLYGPDGLFGHGAKRDAAGVMTIKNIPPGTYKTNVSYWSYSQSEKTVEIKAGETATIEDVLYAAGSVQWILKKADGSPAQGASVTITPITTETPEQPRSGRTDNTGNWEDRGLAGGTYQVTAQLGGKAAVSEVFEVKAASHTKKERTVTEW